MALRRRCPCREYVRCDVCMAYARSSLFIPNKEHGTSGCLSFLFQLVILFFDNDLLLFSITNILILLFLVIIYFCLLDEACHDNQPLVANVYCSCYYTIYLQFHLFIYHNYNRSWLKSHPQPQFCTLPQSPLSSHLLYRPENQPLAFSQTHRQTHPQPPS